MTAATGPNDAVELTILMPCLNEAETLAVCIRKAQAFLKSSGVSGEVLIADNGSTDGSREITVAEGARMQPVAERGYGAALMGGIKAARGKFVIMGDADDSYDFSNLMPFIEELRKGADVVMGNRFKGGIAPGAMPPLHRYLGNPVLSMLGRIFYKIPVGDFHCGLRGFRRDKILALDLKGTGMEYASEMVVKAAITGLDIQEVPTTLKKDGRSRAPHLKTWRDGWRHLRFLLLHSPKWLFALPGSIMLSLGLVGVALLAAGPLTIAGGVRFGMHTLVASCFSIEIGTQLILFSLMARSFASQFGILPPTRQLESTFRFLSLERLLQLSALLVLSGLTGAIWAFISWAASGFGDITTDVSLRWFVISLTAVTTGIQSAATAFLMSVVRIPGTAPKAKPAQANPPVAPAVTA